MPWTFCDINTNIYPAELQTNSAFSLQIPMWLCTAREKSHDFTDVASISYEIDDLQQSCL